MEERNEKNLHFFVDVSDSRSPGTATSEGGRDRHYFFPCLRTGEEIGGSRIGGRV